MSSKSDPPSLKLDAPFVKDLAALGFAAFDDPEEITSTTLEAAKTIYDDQKTNRRDSENAKSLLALLAVLIKMRKEQRAAARRLRQILYTIGVIVTAVWALDKLGVIKITLH